MGERIGTDVAIGDELTLRAYLVTQTGGTLVANYHRAFNWVGAAAMADLAWVPADRAWLPALRGRLTR